MAGQNFGFRLKGWCARCFAQRSPGPRPTPPSLLQAPCRPPGGAPRCPTCLLCECWAGQRGGSGPLCITRTQPGGTSLLQPGPALRALASRCRVPRAHEWRTQARRAPNPPRPSHLPAHPTPTSSPTSHPHSSVRNNRLTGPLPEGWGTPGVFKNLKALALQNNSLSGARGQRRPLLHPAPERQLCQRLRLLKMPRQLVPALASTARCLPACNEAMRHPGGRTPRDATQARFPTAGRRPALSQSCKTCEPHGSPSASPAVHTKRGARPPARPPAAARLPLPARPPAAARLQLRAGVHTCPTACAHHLPIQTAAVAAARLLACRSAPSRTLRPP